IKDGFEPLMVSLFGCLVSPQDHVLDIGANIGCTSLLLGELARRVLSFEPSPTTFSFLERNIRASGLGNIEVQNFALGSEPCESQITFAPNNRAGAFVSDKTKASIGHTTERI
ncbi:MAG TPA: FkbM family methyltransferase, partial [Casimicrobiaceae bacterium]|nr:FkbM family methyltransferase [Casimicrobiaceae bacterium]